MRVRVECYSGYRADERPLRFRLGARVIEVERVEDRWYSPDSTWFRVKGSDGNLYVLRHLSAADRWIVDAYRRQ